MNYLAIIHRSIPSSFVSIREDSWINSILILRAFVF
jgi:hypothetical protein